MRLAVRAGIGIHPESLTDSTANPATTRDGRTEFQFGEVTEQLGGPETVGLLKYHDSARVQTAVVVEPEGEHHARLAWPALEMVQEPPLGGRIGAKPPIGQGGLRHGRGISGTARPRDLGVPWKLD